MINQNKLLAITVALIVAAVIAFVWPNDDATASYQTNIYRTDGGDKLVCASGGIVDHESGCSFEIAGVAITATAAELNAIDGFLGDVIDLNYAKLLYDTGVTTTEYDILDGLTSTAAELNALDGITASVNELNITDGVTSTAAEINILDDMTDPGIDGALVITVIAANADIDDATASTKWATSDQANWTIDAGTANGRDGGNTMELVTDATVDDELEMDYGSAFDISAYSFIGFWFRNGGGDIVADAFDVELRTPADTVITNCDDLDIPAADANDWHWIEFNISTCTDLTRFSKVIFEADTNIAAYTAVDIGGIIAYKFANGRGPVQGQVAYYPVSSGTVTRGEVACFPEIGNQTVGVETCDANDYVPAGIAVTTSASNVALQISGKAILRTGNAVSDNADIDVLSGAVTIDDAGTQENSFGYALEISDDAGDEIEVRLMFH